MTLSAQHIDGQQQGVFNETQMERLMKTLKLKAILATASLVIAASLSSARAETFTLRIGAGHPATSIGYVVAANKFFVPETAKRVAARTNHRLNWVELYGGTAAKLPEVLTATQNGVLDVGLISYSFDTTNLYLHALGFYIPFSIPDPHKSIAAMRAVYDEVPFFRDVLEQKFNQRFLALGSFSDYGFGTNFAMKSFADLKGKKMGLAGPNAPWVRNTGVTPVVSNLNEAYNALQSNIYQAFMVFPNAYHGFKLHEVSKTYVVAGLGSPAATGMTMNLATWKKLPPEVQQIIQEVALEYEKACATIEADGHKQAIDNLRAAKVTIVELSEQDRKAWAEAVKDVPNDAAKEANRRGLPGSAAFKSYFKQAQALGYQWPAVYPID